MKKAQIWESTILYTLIGLAVMGILLAAVRPKIAEIRDKATIEQTISTLSQFDDVIMRARQATGTRLSYILQMSSGELQILPEEEKIIWTLPESNFAYSEPTEKEEADIIVSVGVVKATTKKITSGYSVSLWLDYSETNIDLSFNEDQKEKILNQATTPYKLWVENLGTAEQIKIDIKIG